LDEPLKVAIVGCGFVAKAHHLPCYRKIKGVNVVAACDKSKKSLQRFCQKFHVGKSYQEIELLLSNESLDFVDICTPPQTHYQLCLTAINHGVNVLVEKPIAINPEQTIDLNNLSLRKNVKVCVVHNYRFRKPVLKAMEMYEKGRLGKIKQVVSTIHMLSAFPEWVWDEEQSGGFLYDSALHFVDLQTFFCGEHDKIVGANIENDDKIGLTTDIQTIIKYKAGAVGIIDMKAFSSSGRGTFDIYGTAADVHLKFYPDYFNLSVGNLGPYSELIDEFKRFSNFAKYLLLLGMKKYRVEYHYKLISDYVKAIKENKEPPVPISSVINTMKLMYDLSTHMREKSHH